MEKILQTYVERLEVLGNQFKRNLFTEVTLRQYYYLLHSFYSELISDVDLSPKDNIFCYRGLSLPVEVDDYGQQLYIEYKGEGIPGGSFNPTPWHDFAYGLDQLLDAEILGVDYL